jgi:hypothetical protein
MPLPLDLARFRDHPSMYLAKVDFDTVAAFVGGYDLAASGRLLDGFQDWMRPRIRRGHEFGWPLQVLLVAFPDDERAPWPRPDTPERQAHAITTLFQLLEEFCEDRGRPASGTDGPVTR